MTKRWRTVLRKSVKSLGWMLGISVVALVCLDQFVLPLPKEKLTRPHSQFVYSRGGHLLSCFTSSDRFWRKPVALRDISPQLIRCVLACEDQWFYYHPGVNPVSLISALIDNVRAGHVVRGGSTVTMQIARMIEPKGRSVGNKLIEVFRALQLELRYSKTELLEFYFNLAPYGGNLEGVGAATQFYFDKPPADLSLSECAILAAIPASPSNFRPDRDIASCERRRNRVLEYLKHKGAITTEECASAEQEEIPEQRFTRPFIAPHFCQSLAAADPDSVVLTSTIDLQTQQICERLAKQHQARLDEKDIHNLALVVLDNATGEVLGEVGAADFEDLRHQGQINGACAARSPGSALKPFAYALGFDLGLITPESRIGDIPVNYHGYTPENYDDEFHGVVSVHEALSQSYNVPAVIVASKVDLRRFYDLLTAGGISTLERQPEQYGLPLVLGACEVSLIELSNLYATLARGGVPRHVKQLLAEQSVPGERLFSPEACYLASEILSDLQRPDFPASWEFTTDLPRIAWKTGTSYGRRDAWTIGYNPRYTVGVWAGNFSGRGSPDIVGAGIAAPLMFNVFNEIGADRECPWFDIPEGVEMRRVCAVSGMLPGEFCPETIEAECIRGKSDMERCTVHQDILVDRATGYRLCPYCSAGRPCDEVTVAQWPPKIASWLSTMGQARPMPPHNPDCQGMLTVAGPVITSPEDDAVYVLQPGIPESYQKILLQASLAPSADRAYWFVDHQWFASCGLGESVFYAPTVGRHRLMCVDDQGRSESVTIEVK